jgi:GNAT superfamily N-acetyltransferase
MNIVIDEYQMIYQAQIVELILDIQRIEFKLDITIEKQPDLLAIPEYYQHSSGNFWVAFIDNLLVGTIALVDIGNQQVALRKMFVGRSFRGKDFGIAQKLLKHSIQWCHQNNLKEILLGTTPQFKAAHRFYEKNNFRKIIRKNLPSSFPIMSVDKIFYQYQI